MAIIQVKINQSVFVFEDWIEDWVFNEVIWRRSLSFPVTKDGDSEQGIEIHQNAQPNKPWQVYWNGPLLIETFDLAHHSMFPGGVGIGKSLDECKLHVDTFLIKVNNLKAFL
jgi:hypothetical protein